MRYFLKLVTFAAEKCHLKAAKNQGIKSVWRWCFSNECLSAAKHEFFVPNDGNLSPKPHEKRKVVPVPPLAKNARLV